MLSRSRTGSGLVDGEDVGPLVDLLAESTMWFQQIQVCGRLLWKASEKRVPAFKLVALDTASQLSNFLALVLPFLSFSSRA